MTEETDLTADYSDFSEAEWEELLTELKNMLGKKPDLRGLLFLIGVQELGSGPRNFSKEEKQDLMHIAACRVLSPSGFYRLTGRDADGWPIWETVGTLPFMDIFSQEKLLKVHILNYFKSEILAKQKE